MMIRITGAIIFGLALASGCSAPTQPQSAPEGAARSVCRPVFQADGVALAAGTAFVMSDPRNEAQRLLVTAIHLFGPAGGLEADIPWAQMPSRASIDHCAALTDGTPWHGGKALAIPDAARFDDDRFRDIAAFPLDPADANVPALRLAPSTPKVGDRVWLVAQVIGAPATRHLFAATVSYADAGALQYRFDDKTLVFRATSGAPVVNAAGQVVSINLGGWPDGEKRYGLGPSTAVVADALRKAR